MTKDEMEFWMNLLNVIFAYSMFGVAIVAIIGVVIKVSLQK